MIYKSPLKRDLSPDSAGSWEPGLNTIAYGPKSTIQVLRFNETGFTLIEIIAALIVISVLAAMIIPTTWQTIASGTRRTGLQQTAQGVGECRTLFELRGEMERIVGIYKKTLQDSSGNIDLETFWEIVQDDVHIVHIDTDVTGYIEEDGDSFSIDNPSAPKNLFLITLSQDDFRIASIFSKCP